MMSDTLFLIRHLLKLTDKIIAQEHQATAEDKAELERLRHELAAAEQPDKSFHVGTQSPKGTEHGGPLDEPKHEDRADKHEKVAAAPAKK